jgi:hypothetical protein
VNHCGEVFFEIGHCDGDDRRRWEVKVCVEDTAEIGLTDDRDWAECVWDRLSPDAVRAVDKVPGGQRPQLSQHIPGS